VTPPFEATDRRLTGLKLPVFGVRLETIGGVEMEDMPVFGRLRSLVPPTPARKHRYCGTLNGYPMPKHRVSNPVTPESTLQRGVRFGWMGAIT
jgi:hypothetical protein